METVKEFNLKNHDFKLILQYNFEDDLFRYIDRKTDELIKTVQNIENNSELTHELIQVVVEDYFGLYRGELMKKTRKHEIVYPRHIAVYFSVLLNIKTKGQAYFKSLADAYGYKLNDHASIMYGYNKIKLFLTMKHEAELRQHVGEIQERLNILTQ